jgi:hypothetical protein
MTADWYQKLFPATRLSPQRAAVPEFEMTAQGCRIATSVGGVLTGRGADFIIIDDPLKPEEVLSQAQRQAANEWYDHTLYSRLNDKLSGAIVLVIHRLHEDDLAGHVLGQEDWDVVLLPAIAEADEWHRVETVFGSRVFGRKAGEALHPEREPPEMLAQLRRTLGEYPPGTSSRGLPASTSRRRRHLGGGMIKAAWVQELRGKRASREIRPDRAELGHCQQGLRAQAPPEPSPACGGGKGGGALPEALGARTFICCT